MLLPIEVYKVADLLFATQKDGYVSYSVKSAKSMHMPKEVVEIAIQTLIDRQILDSPSNEGFFWKFRINADSIKRYNDASWDDINDAPVLRQSSEVTFTHEQKKNDSMDVQAMRKQIEELQKLIMMQTRDNNNEDSLPW